MWQKVIYGDDRTLERLNELDPVKKLKNIVYPQLVAEFFKEDRPYTIETVLKVVSVLVKQEPVFAQGLSLEQFILQKFVPAVIKQQRAAFAKSLVHIQTPPYKEVTPAQVKNVLNNLYGFLTFLLKTHANDESYVQTYYTNGNIREVYIDITHKYFHRVFNIEDGRLVITVPHAKEYTPEEIAQQLDDTFKYGFTFFDHRNEARALEGVLSQLKYGQDYSLLFATDRDERNELFRGTYRGYADRVKITNRVMIYLDNLRRNGTNPQAVYFKIKERVQ